MVSTGQSLKVFLLYLFMSILAFSSFFFWLEPEGIQVSVLYFYFSLFFPPGTSITCGNYTVDSENIENYEDFIVTDLR